MLVHAYNSAILESDGELCIPWCLSNIVRSCLSLKKKDVKINSNSEEILFQIWNVLLRAHTAPEICEARLQ